MSDSPKPENRAGALRGPISYGRAPPLTQCHSHESCWGLGPSVKLGFSLEQGSHLPDIISRGHQGAPQLASSTRGLLEPSIGGPLSVAPLQYQSLLIGPQGRYLGPRAPARVDPGLPPQTNAFAETH